MPTYAVESKRQAMETTGIVNETPVWETGVDGKRRPSRDQQDRHPDTGMPLWDVEVKYVTETFGRQATVTANVQVGALERPDPEPNKAISFKALVVDVQTRRTGMVEYWRAEEIDSYTSTSGASESKSAPRTTAGAPGKEKAA